MDETEVEVFVVELAGQFPGLNEVIARAKLHWGVYAALKKEYSSWVLLQAPRAGRNPAREYSVGVVIDWYCRDRRRDPDNIASGKKFILDGLVAARVLRNDGWANIRYFEDRFHVDSDNSRAVVRLMVSEKDKLLMDKAREEVFSGKDNE